MIRRVIPSSVPSQSIPNSGFATLVAVFLSILLSIVAISLLSLASIQLRGASASEAQMVARANARLALNIAIGELQTFLGPDQRVSAPSAIFEENEPVVHPHWMGVWSSRRKGGGSYWERDDFGGGLRDARAEEEGWNAREEVLSYLVSGNEGGQDKSVQFRDPDATPEEGTWATLVSSGTLGDAASPERDYIRVPKVPVIEAGQRSGSYGFWVGDLGVRANIATADAWKESEETEDEEESGAEGTEGTGEESESSADEEDGSRDLARNYQAMLSQEVDAAIISTLDEEESINLNSELRTKLISDGQIALAAPSPEWSQSVWHQVTTWSQGVLSDVREGGLKKNLTVYLEDETPIATGDRTDRLLDSDNLVGPRNEEHAEQLGQDWEKSRYRTTAPTFGMLRNWVQQSVQLEEQNLPQRSPETERTAEPEIGGRSAFANEESVKLANRSRSDLRPILVEGSSYFAVSFHPNRAGSRWRYNIRSHRWPRVVLWNPYNVSLTIPKSVVMMHLNSRNHFRTGAAGVINDRAFSGDVQWLTWGGGTRTPPPRSGEEITESDNFNDPYTGMQFFTIPEEEIGPGECLFFSPAEAAEYDSRNILSNVLSADVAPDPSRNFYVSSGEFDGDDGSGFDFRLFDFFFHPARNLNNQADDARMIWKDASDYDSASIFDFDVMPQLQTVSCSLQYGAGKEPRVAWNEVNRIPIEMTDLDEPRVTLKPDVRTREGFRLRWFEEHPSNTGVLNSPAGPAAFETALLANWNPRASFSIRSPWDNISGDQGDGLASGPWFFGAYTRDLYDSLVGWDQQLPFFEEGKYRGNPFGPPQEGQLRNILFELPREEVGLLSLAQLQHVKLSEFIWHPSYAVANSLVDPRLGLDGVSGTAPELSGEAFGGWNAAASGWSSDAERAADSDEWARFARFLMKDLPVDENLVYDLSYEVNHSLWDEFFLSSGNEDQRRRFVEEGEALPNGRMRLLPRAELEEINDLNRSASRLMVEGAFNVNSTHIEAWKALLASTRQSEVSPSGNVPFLRNAQSREEEYLADRSFPDDEEAWAGFRSLSEEEIEALAQEIVEQVKKRGPFLSLSDFVNRRLVDEDEETSLMGPLQAAIEAAELNSDFEDRWQLDKSGGDLPDYSHPDNIADSTRLSQTLKPTSKGWGAPGYLTQADLLQVIGPTLSARSDTFLVRSYGEAVDRAGRPTAQAWCEAVVQRTPQPVAPDERGLNPDPEQREGVFGRRFVIRSLRWLTKNEV